MVNQAIQIYARIKPKKSKTSLYEISENADGENIVSFSFPKDTADGYVNNKKELYKFKFQRVFDQNTRQDTVFEAVARPVIDNVLSGYNGTIFAYGQTGSGKTFTITGGAERYEDRGIIPRTLSYIFSAFKKNPEIEYSTYISYLEIYNESGYDLLDPNHEAAKLEDLPKVTMMEDSDQNIHLKNLSTHQVGTEEDSLNLLFLGDTNRMIAETPMNQASTRSHCIFTIHIKSRATGSATVRRSKLHLVDLAGSERVSKTGVNGVLLTEAKYINLSLHYLEQVIVALSEKSRQHIPYRNSMMTSVLRDSLGGNCMTSMIATCSVDKPNIDETVSTCRFAQRVALIKNDVSLNEELDPQLLIGRLKGEIAQLKEQLALSSGDQSTDELTAAELRDVQEMVKVYLEDMSADARMNVGADVRKIHAAFQIMKKEIRILQANQSSGHSARQSAANEIIDNSPYNKELYKLKELLVQRDNEINILVGMLKKEKQKAAEGGFRTDDVRASVVQNRRPDQQQPLVSNGNGDSNNSRASRENEKGRVWTMDNNNYSRTDSDVKAKKILGEMSVGRQEAFEIFRRDYEHNQTIEDNKAVLRQRYAEAKTLGEQVNNCRTSINKVKGNIEQHRVALAMKGRINLDNDEPDAVEMEMRQVMEEEKLKYKEHFNRLKALKTEIEHLQHFLEKSKLKLLKDFESWWSDQMAQAEAQTSLLRGGGQTQTAWNTPPVTPGQASSSSVRSSSLAPLDSRRMHGLADQSRSQPSSNDQSRYTTKTGANSQALYSTSSSSVSSVQRSGMDSVSNSKPSSAGGIPLTGDAQADADIMAFVNARQNVLKQTHQFNAR